MSYFKNEIEFPQLDCSTILKTCRSAEANLNMLRATRKVIRIAQVPFFVVGGKQSGGSLDDKELMPPVDTYNTTGAIYCFEIGCRYL